MAKNKKEIRYFAPSRSGYHAVVDWVLIHHPGKSFYLDLSLPNRQLRHRQRTEEDLRIHTRMSGITEEEFKREIATYPLIDIDSVVDKDLFMHSIENPFDWPEEAKLVGIDLPVWYRGDSDVVLNIIHLRDPFNNIASLVAQSERAPHKILKTYDQWRTVYVGLAKEYLGDTHYLDNVIGVSYNAWFLYEEYRQELGGYLGLAPSCKEPKDSIPLGPGDGSSFTGFEYDGKASQMRVTERYKWCMEHQYFRRLAIDEEVLWLTGRVFSKHFNVQKVYDEIAEVINGK